MATATISDNQAIHPAPRLLRAGIDVSTFRHQELPQAVWSAIETVALLHRRESVRWELACSLCHLCRDRLSRGESPASLIAWLQDPNVRQLLRSAPDIRSTVVETSLPAEILRQVNEARKRLGRWRPGRLRPEERIQGVVELCAKQSAALCRGETIDVLMRTPLRSIVAEIRREQLGKRWWISRVFRRIRMALFWLLLLLAVAWGGLFLRLWSAKPSAANDAIDRFDEINRQVPEGDRAWPLIRDAEILTAARNSPGHYKIHIALAAGPKNGEWKQAREYLLQHQREIDMLIEASKKKGLGRLYRDDGNAAWYRSHGIADWRQVLGRGKSMFQMPAHQLGAYSGANLILDGVYHAAIEDRDPEKACRVLESQIRLQNLILKAPDFAAVVMNSRFQAVETCGEVLELLETEGVGLGEMELASLQDAILELQALIADDATIREPLRFSEHLDAMYSEGPNGRITMQGLKALRAAALTDARLVELAKWLGDPRPMAVPPYSPPQDWTWLTGPVLAPFVLNRAELEAALKRFVPSSNTASSTRPQADAEEEATRREKELADIVASEYQSIRYSPLLMTMSHQQQLKVWGISGGDIGKARFHAAILRIALERHRLRTGRFPERLDSLVPQELPELPPDPYRTGPLGYRLIDGKPLIYSVSLDGVDQTASREYPQGGQRKVDDADLQLSPNLKPENGLR